MRYLKRRGRLAVIALSGILITVFFIEYLSYAHNASYWPDLSKDENVILKVLFVADPQIQGEQQEHYLYGWASRWDADRYLQRNYLMARQHVSPNVVVFLGDLFDEGSIASDPEYRRYFKRFSAIFDLPTSQNPSDMKHIFVPGDNDVGGEKREPVNSVKVNWFSKMFGGDLRSVSDISTFGINIQFMKMNLFMPEEYKSPLKGFEHVINSTRKPDIRLILSHVSLLSFMTNAVEEVIANFHPNLIMSAHTHTSSYLRYLPNGDTRSVHIIHDFLLPTKSHVSESGKGGVVLADQREFDGKDSVKLNLNESEKGIHEIVVPTCSYRMGVQNMGYGAMRIYRDGSIEYTVLWLPSRFKQLFLYAAIYITMKIILTPWLLWKICTFVLNKVKQSRIIERANGYMRVV